MNILFFSPIDLSFGAGFEAWLSKVCLIMKSQMKISVVCSDIGIPKRWNDDLLKLKFKNNSLVKLHYWNFFNKFFFPDFSSLAKLYREFIKNDIIYFNCTFISNDLLIFILSLITRKKVIFAFHAPIFFENKIHNLYFKLITFNLVRFIHAVHVLNSSDEQNLKKYNFRVFNIPAFLLHSEYPEKNFADYEGEFLFVGRYDYQKGLDLLSPAITEIIKTNNKLCFVFYGSGPERPILEKLARQFPNNIELNNFEMNKGKIFKYRKFFILVSRFESCPAVAIEAMSYGLPVIASTISGTIDLVKDAESGFFIPELNQDNIYQTISNASLINKEQYDKMSKKVFLEAQKYSENIFKKKFLKMIKPK